MAYQKLTDEEKAARKAAREAGAGAGLAIVTDGTTYPSYRDLEAEAAPAGVTVMLLVPHLYLPEDPMVEAWQSAATTRYEGKIDGRRARVACHPTLATFLQERGQAEII